VARVEVVGAGAQGVAVADGGGEGGEAEEGGEEAVDDDVGITAGGRFLFWGWGGGGYGLGWEVSFLREARPRAF
jgi:hypothetical protein